MPGPGAWAEGLIHPDDDPPTEYCKKNGALSADEVMLADEGQPAAEHPLLIDDWMEMSEN
jgi:hypothetical protein